MRHPKPSILADIPHDRPTVIEASAGTGKTYTLEHLVVSLVLDADVPLEKILVVTYTERAAAELRVRLRAKLRSLLEPPRPEDAEKEGPAGAWVIDDAAKKKLHAAITTFDLASISTIHAFCQETLRDNAFASRRLFEQKLVDGRVAFGHAFLGAMRRTLAREPEPGAPGPRLRDYLEAWLASGRDLDGLRDLLYECHQHRGRLRPEWSEGQFVTAVAALRENLVPAHFFEYTAKASGVSSRSLGALVTRWEKLRAALDPARSVPAQLEAVSELAGDLEFILERVPPGKVHDARVRAALSAMVELQQGTPPLDSAIAQLFLPAITGELQREKQRTGQLDFDDMLAMLWEALEGEDGEALARSIRGRYSHALVDEFQDTDDVQWKIFRRLFLEAPEGAPAKNVLYVVGDPKQAIYAFRGADVHTYLDAVDHLLAAGGARVTLTESWRSTVPFVAGLNTILDQQRSPAFFDGRIRYDAPVVAARPPKASDLPGAPIRLWEVVPRAGQDKASSAAVRATLGARMAAELRQLLAEAEAERARREDAGITDTSDLLRASDVFVLARSKDDCVEAARHLRAAGIPNALYKQEGLFQTDEARDILDLLTAIVDPGKQSRRFTAWMGPFFAVPVESLGDCVDLPATHPLMAKLLGWAQHAALKDYTRLFGSVLEDSGIIERELFFDDSERKLTNYLHIFELLLEEASRTRPTLEDLVHLLTAFVEGRRAPEGENGNVQRLETERDAVQVMTMHKSKGLEARVVFVYGAFAARREGGVLVYHDGGERCLAVGRADGAAKIAVERERTEENERLLYVALTRAKERVYLPYFAPVITYLKSGEARKRRPTAEPEAAFLRLLEVLDPLVERMEKGAAPELAALFSREVLTAVDLTSDALPKPPPPALSAWTPPEPLLRDVAPDPELRALRARRAGLWITSYSRIKASKGGYQPPLLPVAEEDDVAGDTGLGAAPETSPLAAVAASAPLEEEGATAGRRVRLPTDLPGGSASGRFLHEVLEKVPFETVREAMSLDFWCARTDVREVFVAAMKNHDRDPRYLRHAQELIHAALAAPIKLGKVKLEGGIASARQIVREMEFLYPSVEPELIKGYIDLVFEHDEKIYLLDWKSDLLPSYAEDALRNHTEQNYGLQAELYALALVRMLGISTRERYDALFGGTVYCFVRGMSVETPSAGVLYFRPSWREILESERKLRSGELAGAAHTVHGAEG